MDDLISFYERELGQLRASLAEFAARYPKAAARLSISGQHSEDPQVERMIQSAALLNARTTARLEDDVPEFTKPLLEVAYPEYLRAFPSCTIACFESIRALDRLTEPAVIKRRTELKTQTGEYPFETAYEVTLAPIRVVDAGFRMPTAAPAAVCLSDETTGVLSISFDALIACADLRSIVPDKVRVFVDGSAPSVAATIDAFLQRALGAFVEVDGSGRWTALPQVPVSAAGFDDDDAMIERADRQRSPFRLLLEYFAFPQKFDFVDIDLATLLRGNGPRNRVDLHIPVRGIHPDSFAARVLRELGPANFRLSCTPAVNLFRLPAEPVVLKDMTTPVYPLAPQTFTLGETSVWTVDAVRVSVKGGSSTTIAPVPAFESLNHHGRTGAHGARGPFFWVAERDRRLAEFVAGQDTLLAFVGIDGRPVEPAGFEQIHADLRCTNRNLPAAIAPGNPAGDFVNVVGARGSRIVMLRRPTVSQPRPGKPGRYWNLVSLLSPGTFSLNQAGLPALKELLSGHVPKDSQPAARHIDAIVGLAGEPVMEWVIAPPQSQLERGLRIRLVVDDVALAGYALSTFTRVLESVFVRYAPAHSFVQVVLISANNGAELTRSRLLRGTTPLI
ncbi:type VI secretion system baseplate subunit TssF [Paraburkholderia guartelaensis]|uniref:Type VI secretion system baseplate subunit TssF n=1 Tax=Paraburkholderia guartelaensis TaxID=2546446 RepID=A0A4R5L0W3_9BURK|nr:type VI secretion system baseplate subunit TssF [Paraburkholderia guartelaensis]TDG02106.1 type VI secretion system baseplate subunit TssF [Paraburkholderia guartelaensis]